MYSLFACLFGIKFKQNVFFYFPAKIKIIIQILENYEKIYVNISVNICILWKF